MPRAFTARFLDRLHDGKLDCGQALDLCELNPSPAANVALAAVRRWGRPAGDLERAVALAHRVETDRLRRNVGNLAPDRRTDSAAGPSGDVVCDLRRALGSTARRQRGLRRGGTGRLGAGLRHSHAAFGRHRDRHALADRLRRLVSSGSRSWPAASTGSGAETIDAIAMAAPLDTDHGTGPRRAATDSLEAGRGRAGIGPAARSPHQSYFRLDDGTGMIRHPGEHSNEPVTKLPIATRGSSAWASGSEALYLSSTLGYHGETLAGSLPARKRLEPGPGRIEEKNPSVTPRQIPMTGLDLESFLLLLRADLGVWLMLGLAILGLAFLVWSSWSSRRALRNCLVLSLAAHLALRGLWQHLSRNPLDPRARTAVSRTSGRTSVRSGWRPWSIRRAVVPGIDRARAG